VVKVPGALRLAVARHLARGLEQQTAAARARCAFRHARRRDPSKLRIGYVSPDFRTHAVGTLVHGLFRHHDRDAVSVHAYSLVDVDDPFQRSVRSGVDTFADVSREPPEAIARRIHADGIDVLVDLAGYTTYSRTSLFVLRPAPVQAHWLGYLDTMGADFLPYVIADDRVIPEQAAADFSETVVPLPGGFAVASELPIDEAPLSRADEGLPEGAFVFCCMNALHKLDVESFDVWMRILARVPESVLWLSGETSQRGRSNLAREATRRGIDPSRLVYAPRAPLPRYLARYRLADLFLDTFAYNAGATAVGALRAGLPVLTRPGDTYMARMGSSLCACAGIPEMICEDVSAYEERAVALATDPQQLASVRARLAEGHRTARLFDPRRCARELEAAYRAMWRHQLEGAADRRIRAEPRC
jgi:predicted O-linked N-acetylglucosamine transferase (SPINDLY family)